jgi:site-specific DNA-cytosine methylase
LADAGYSNIEWRILNSQFFGVAQRRRRVFIVASLGAEPFRTILSEREGSAGDLEASDQEGQEVTRDANHGSGASGARAGNFELYDFPDSEVAPSLNALRARDTMAYGSWWDGGQISQTLDTVIAKQQMMPEKNRFPVVLQERNVVHEIS